MSALHVRCPNPECNFSRQVKEDLAGKSVKCPQCKTKFAIPSQQAKPQLTVFNDQQSPPATPAPLEQTIPQPAPVAEPQISEQPASAEQVTLSAVSFSDLGWKGTLDTALASPKVKTWQRRLEPYIPIAARISIILCLLYVVESVRIYLNPFTMIPNVVGLLFLFFRGGFEALLTSEAAVRLIMAFGVLYLVKSWWYSRSFKTGGVYGSAAWASEMELTNAKMLGGQGLILGRVPLPHFSTFLAIKHVLTKPLLESDAVNRYFVTAITRGFIPAFTSSQNMICLPKGKYVHLMTVAPAGAGKGVGLVIPNLLNYAGSVIILDPKGENFKATADQRRSKLWSNVLCLDPFGITGSPSSTFNPFDLLNPLSPTLVDDVVALTDALIVKTEKDHDPHWNEKAGLFLKAVILLVAYHARDEERNLNMVRKILSNKNDLRAAMKVMLDSTVAGGALADVAGQMDAIVDNEFSSILSSANRHIEFLNSPLVAANIAQSSFDMTHIAESNTSLYLVLPPQYLRTHARLMRLWVNCILMVVKNRGATEKDEMLFILDEVAQLGELEPLEDAVTLLRGYGVRMWFFLQSLDQLKVCFPGAHANVLLSNFGVQQFFGINDLETARYISERIGKTTVSVVGSQSSIAKSTARTIADLATGGSHTLSKSVTSGQSATPTERDLIRPEEVLRARDSVFIFTPHVNPVLANRLTYYSDPEFEAAKEGTGLVSAELKPQSHLPKVSRISYALAVCGVLLIASSLYSSVNRYIEYRHMLQAREEYMAKQAAYREAAEERRKQVLEERKLKAEERRQQSYAPRTKKPPFSPKNKQDDIEER